MILQSNDSPAANSSDSWFWPINNLSDFKAWLMKYPNARKLLSTIIYKWRRNTQRIEGEPGYWSVHTRAEWGKWSGLTLKQYNTALVILKRDKLLRTKIKAFKGKTPHSWLQPTELALKYLGEKGDLDRLKDDYKAGKSVKPRLPKKINKGNSVGNSVGSKVGNGVWNQLPPIYSSDSLTENHYSKEIENNKQALKGPCAPLNATLGLSAHGGTENGQQPEKPLNPAKPNIILFPDKGPKPPIPNSTAPSPPNLQLIATQTPPKVGYYHPDYKPLTSEEVFTMLV